MGDAVDLTDSAYSLDQRMTAEQAEQYHSTQIATLATADVDLIEAMTFNSVSEAVGVARASSRAGLPASILFTLDSNHRLHSGPTLKEAIEAVDAECGDDRPAFYGINCSHPLEFLPAIEAGGWFERIRCLRPNAATGGNRTGRRSAVRSTVAADRIAAFERSSPRHSTGHLSKAHAVTEFRCHTVSVEFKLHPYIHPPGILRCPRPHHPFAEGLDALDGGEQDAVGPEGGASSAADLGAATDALGESEHQLEVGVDHTSAPRRLRHFWYLSPTPPDRSVDSVKLRAARGGT